MSRDNVEVVRAIYDAVVRRDADTPFSLYAEDIVWDVSQSQRSTLFARPVYHGHAGVREAWRESLSAFGQVDFEVEEIVDADDKVVATLCERVVGRASGAPAETSHTAVWTLADGKVVHTKVFKDPVDALESAGLSA